MNHRIRVAEIRTGALSQGGSHFRKPQGIKSASQKNEKNNINNSYGRCYFSRNLLRDCRCAGPYGKT
jgi:hypothetical protein